MPTNAAQTNRSKELVRMALSLYQSTAQRMSALVIYIYTYMILLYLMAMFGLRFFNAERKRDFTTHESFSMQVKSAHVAWKFNTGDKQVGEK